MEKLRNLYDRFGCLILALVAFSVIILTLFLGDDIGLSDNGDFTRVISASSIEKTDVQNRFVYVSGYKIKLNEGSAGETVWNLLFSDEGLDRYPSVHIAFVRISALCNYGINALTGSVLNSYRLGVLGTIYAVFYSFALYLLFKRLNFKNRILNFSVMLLLIIVLCDTGYTAYFNSFYSEPVQMIGFLLLSQSCIGIIQKRFIGVRHIVYMSLSGILYGWSKFANIPVALAVIIVFTVIAFLKSRKLFFVPVSAVALGVLLWVFAIIPGWMEFETNYNAVFYGALYDVPEEKGAHYLADLDLPQEYISLKNTNAYVASVQSTIKSAEFKDSFSHMSKTELLGFYFKNPEQLLKLGDIAIKNSGFIRPYYLSNYSGAYPRFTQSHRFSLWSDLRIHLGFDNGVINILILIIFSVLLFFICRREEFGGILGFCLCILCVIGALLYCLLVPMISNGVGDVSKHMFAYAQFMDLIFFSSIFMAMGLRLKKGWQNLCMTAAVVLMVIIVPVFSAVNKGIRAMEGHERPETGAYVNFGTDESGKPLTWLVTGENGDELELLAVQSVGEKYFSDTGEFGSNYWKESSLRSWLNGEFLNSFTSDESGFIVKGDNKYLLSGAYREKAEGGSNDFYCLHIPELSANGYDEAVYAETSDSVYLPDIKLISELAGQGINIAGDRAYWLETPYYSNGSMLRTVYPDGYIYFRDAIDTAEVRPMIRIKAFSVVNGNGSWNNPFIAQC